MVNLRQSRKQERIGARYGKSIFLWVFAVVLIICAIVFIRVRNNVPLSRINIVIAGNPILLLSYSDREDSVLISIPSDTYINGVYGYGSYSLPSLWKLGIIDKHHDLLAKSLEDSIGVPVSWYIGENEELQPVSKPPLENLKGFFGLSSAGKYFTHKFITNLPPGLFLKIFFKIKSLSIDKTNVIDLSGSKALVPSQLPDNTSISILDPVNLDLETAKLFEEPKVRRESLSVAIYNTTDFPSLGSRIARILTNLGILVVAVNNENTNLKECTITVAGENKNSLTVDILKNLLNCNIVDSGDANARADLELRLGINNQERYLPIKK